MVKQESFQDTKLFTGAELSRFDTVIGYLQDNNLHDTLAELLELTSPRQLEAYKKYKSVMADHAGEKTDTDFI